LIFSPTFLLQAISRYFKKELKKESTQEDDEPKPTKIKQFYTIRDVIKQKHRKLVEEQIPYESTDKRYIGSYQRAVTAVLQDMSKEDLEDAENIIDKWNKDGAPQAVQLK
jgi:hypothetical protein